MAHRFQRVQIRLTGRLTACLLPCLPACLYYALTLFASTDGTNGLVGALSRRPLEAHHGVLSAHPIHPIPSRSPTASCHPSSPNLILIISPAVPPRCRHRNKRAGGTESSPRWESSAPCSRSPRGQKPPNTSETGEHGSALCPGPAKDADAEGGGVRVTGAGCGCSRRRCRCRCRCR